MSRQRTYAFRQCHYRVTRMRERWRVAVDIRCRYRRLLRHWRRRGERMCQARGWISGSLVCSFVAVDHHVFFSPRYNDHAHHEPEQEFHRVTITLNMYGITQMPRMRPATISMSGTNRFLISRALLNTSDNSGGCCSRPIRVMTYLHTTAYRAWIIPHGRTIDDDAHVPGCTRGPYDQVTRRTLRVGDTLTEMRTSARCHRAMH